MNLDIDMFEEATADDLPYKAEYEMFPAFCKICRANVDNRAADSLCGCDYNVVILGHLEIIQGFLCGWNVQNTDINRFGNGVVDEFAKKKTISALVEYLHVVCGD